MLETLKNVILLGGTDFLFRIINLLASTIWLGKLPNQINLGKYRIAFENGVYDMVEGYLDSPKAENFTIRLMPFSFCGNFQDRTPLFDSVFSNIFVDGMDVATEGVSNFLFVGAFIKSIWLDLDHTNPPHTHICYI